VDIGAGFEAPVMARVLGERRTPRRYRLFAAAALASLAAAAGVTLLFVPHHAPAPPTAGRDAARPVRFELIAPQASSVAVVGDFNDWSMSGIPLSRAASGRWTRSSTPSKPPPASSDIPPPPKRAEERRPPN